MADEQTQQTQTPPEQTAPEETQQESPTDAEAGSQARTFTQAEFDRLFEARRKRERKAWEEELEAERRKAAMTEAEKLTAEKDEAEKRAAEAAEAANGRVVRAEARVALAAAGIKTERIDRAIRLLDLSGVAVDDNGDPDVAAITGQIDALLKDFPELKGVAQTGAAGQEFGGQTPGPDPASMSMSEYMAWRKKTKE